MTKCLKKPLLWCSYCWKMHFHVWKLHLNFFPHAPTPSKRKLLIPLDTILENPFSPSRKRGGAKAMHKNNSSKLQIYIHWLKKVTLVNSFTYLLFKYWKYFLIFNVFAHEYYLEKLKKNHKCCLQIISNKYVDNTKF